MAKLTQVGVSIIVLGIVITLIGLFPTLTGLEPTPGIGLLQIFTFLAGFCVLIGGAYLFVQSSYYAGIKHNLAQQIAIRLSLTGLVLSIASGLADVLGFGSHPIGVEDRPLFGPLQVLGVIIGFLIASLGVIMFALMGPHPQTEANLDNDLD